jgi:hypothetical protein
LGVPSATNLDEIAIGEVKMRKKNKKEEREGRMYGVEVMRIVYLFGYLV